MLIFLAAATALLAATPVERLAPEARPAAIPQPFAQPASPLPCKAAGRLQTSLVQPALLYREQDRDAGRARRLIDLPMGEMCLLGAAGRGSEP